MVDITSMFKVEPIMEIEVKTPLEIEVPVVEAPKKFLLSIDLKKETDDEDEF